MSSFRNVFLSVEDKSCFRCINILKKFTREEFVGIGF